MLKVPGAAGNINEAAGVEALYVTCIVPSPIFWNTLVNENFIFGPALDMVPVPDTTTLSVTGSNAPLDLNLYSYTTGSVLDPGETGGNKFTNSFTPRLINL